VTASAGIFDYGDVRSSDDGTNPWTSSPLVITRNNVTYSVTQVVAEYYYDLLSDSFTTAAPVGAFTSDYKTVAVTVNWGTDREFIIQEGVDTGDPDVTSDANLGGGLIQVSSVISAQTVSSIGRVAEESDSDIIAPDVFYTPGANPDIVALELNDAGDRFKESLTPEPEVTRSDELVDTRFDVITYSTGNANSLFLRREEFAAVSCECTLKAPPNVATAGGRRPTVWLGDEYRDPDFIAKAYGISENGQQSRLCNTCCRDHHDDNDHGGENVFNPYRPSADYQVGGAFRGDHKHYKKDQRGNLSVALADDTYVEACRLVRKDGFFVVAQDFDLGSLNVFPYDFLVGPADILSTKNDL
jgi:hypothetical protein